MERLRPGDPEQIGPWQIVNRLGAGGMGLVYLGTNGTRSAAIKTVRPHLLEDPTSRTRLSREVESLKKVKSAFIAEIVGSDVVSSPAWIATNFVDGPSLKALVENEGPMKEKAWIEFAIGLFHALSAVHKVGIIHRDIKPSNILISSTGPKLIDFGISFSNEATSLTRTGLVAGTPAWLAPEQFENREISFAVDNFALGSVLTYAATGAAPWGSDESSVAQVMRKILSDDPDLSKLTSIQKNIISKLLEKDPRKRLTSPEGIQLLGADDEVFDRGVGSNSTVNGRNISKRKNMAMIAGILAGVVIIGGVFLIPKSSKVTAIKPSQSNSTPISTPSQATSLAAGNSQNIAWSGEFVGDVSTQNGFGSQYTIYVCDQNISPTSLSVSASDAPSHGGEKSHLVFSDPTCGSGFDTIYVSGPVPSSGTKKYLLSAKTKAGQKITYNYSITRK
jgi:serine/threonine protein kinase